MPLSPEETADVLRHGESLTNQHVADCLQSLLDREKGLLDHTGEDTELREIVVHNITCLVAAIARLIPNQIASPQSGTPSG